MCQFVFRICLVLVLTPQVWQTSDYPQVHSVFGALFNARPPAATSLTTDSTSALCLGCSQKYVEVDQDHVQQRYTVTEEELTALRIEYIKNQILKKLRLKKKPIVSIANLPKPVTEDENLVPKGYDQSTPSPFDDYYGRTTQAIIFPYEEQARCMKKVRHPSVCLPFQLPSDIHADDLSTAELWFHKEPDEQDTNGQTFVVTEVAHWDTKKSFQKTTPIAIHHTNLTDAWIKVDVAQVIRNWLEYQDSPIHAINVACKTCARDLKSSPVSFKMQLKPFLVIYTHNQQKRLLHKRPKRNSNCSPNLNECCRESLYVSFAEIGWDDWIIQPAGYNAYFCRGSCTTVASVTLSATQHSSIMQVAKLFSYTWAMGPFLCKSVHYVQNLSTSCSVLTLTAISIERYYAIVHPMRAKYVCTNSQAKRIILLTWCLAILLAIPILCVQVQMEVGDRFKAHWCVRDWDNKSLWRFHEVYMLLLVLVGPTCIMTCTYSLICWEIWRVMEERNVMTSRNALSRNRVIRENYTESIDLSDPTKIKHSRRSEKEDTRVVKQVIYMLVAVVVLFTICWGPLLIDNVLTAYTVLPKQRTGYLKYMGTAFHLMAYFNSCINPIIYGFMSKNFRDSFRSALCCRKKTISHYRNGTRCVSSFRNSSQTRTTSIR